MKFQVVCPQFLQPFSIGSASFRCPVLVVLQFTAVCWHLIAVMGVVDNLGLYSAGFKETKVIGNRKSTAMISINFSFLEQNISKPFHAYLAWHRHQVHICNNLLKYDVVTDLLRLTRNLSMTHIFHTQKLIC